MSTPRFYIKANTYSNINPFPSWKRDADYWEKDVSNNLFYLSGNVGIGFTNPKAKFSVDGTVGIGTNVPQAALDVSGNVSIKNGNMTVGNTGYPYYATLGTYNIVNPPSSTGTINGVNITALNKRTRTSYAAAEQCVSTWTVREFPNYDSWRSICWSPELGIFVVGGPDKIIISYDGIKWSDQVYPSGSLYGWICVCWSPELRIFVVLSNLLNYVLTSSNGITWTSHAVTVSNDWTAVCWSPELGIFVAVGSNGNTIMTSQDGINWIARITGISNGRTCLCWSPELGIFVTGGNNVMTTSQNGINWTAHSIPANGTSSVCWSPELGIFVALSSTDSSTNVITSSDGKNWILRSVPINNNWASVCWSPELSIFVAVASFVSSNSYRVMTSPDGINWTARISERECDWESVCWSPELSIFVAVASEEYGVKLGQRIMTSAIGMPNAKSVVKALPSQVSVDVNGNVGIGTSNPQYRLDVSGNGSFASNLQVLGFLKAKVPVFNATVAIMTFTAYVNTRLTLNTPTIDNINGKVGNTYRPNVPGLYLVYGFLMFDKLSSSIELGIELNSTTVLTNISSGQGLFNPSATIVGIFYFNGTTDNTSIRVITSVNGSMYAGQLSVTYLSS